MNHSVHKNLDYSQSVGVVRLLILTDGDLQMLRLLHPSRWTAIVSQDPGIGGDTVGG
jgi:hypothetical protein